MSVGPEPDVGPPLCTSQSSKKKWQQYEAETVLSPVQATALDVCTTFSCLIRATIESRSHRLGEDG